MIGKPDEKVLDAILETLPVEFSALDKNDKVLCWNKHETRIFKRPEAALGRDVKKCHPPKSLDKVEQILKEMKEGKRDIASFWIDLPIGKNKEMRKILIQYFAVRDKNGKYLGCLEASQDITDIQKITGQKRLLE
ncbi:MAG TPA: PAS domain S-box protein [Bacteroidetes bacterium]|nr:PAS domain S-box protein [Bacteroidota bacterium]